MAPTRRTTTASLAAGVLATVLTGCGGGGAPSVAPSDPPTTAATSGQPPAATSSGPTLEAASGPLLRTTYVQARIPSGWHAAAQDVSFQRAGNDDGGQEIDVGYFPTIGSGSFEHLADAMNRDTLDGKGTVMPPVMINGVKYAHVQGRQYQLQVDDYETYVVSDISHIAGVTFSLDRSGTADQRRAVIDQVLATLRVTP